MDACYLPAGGFIRKLLKASKYGPYRSLNWLYATHLSQARGLISDRK